MPDNLSARLRARIAAEGPLTVAQYMEAALLDPEVGYYTTRSPFGTQGDFITAPDISQIFGELIGLFFADRWHQMGQPRSVLAEAGPGRGTLMRDMLRATARIPGFHDALSIVLIEASEALQAVQKHTIAGAHPRLRWQPDLSTLPDLPLFFIANEWLDALPIRQFQHTPEGWRERLVEVDSANMETFRFTLSASIPPCIPPQAGGVSAYSALTSLLPPAEGAGGGNPAFFEICEPAISAVRTLAQHLARHGGDALLIDYGYTHGHGDTLQAVKSHAFHPPLLAPGSADITAHVDFAALMRTAQAEGVQAEITPQGAWLKRLGAELRAAQLCRTATPGQRESVLSGLHRLVSPEEMGELFKVLHLAQRPSHGTGDGPEAGSASL